MRFLPVALAAFIFETSFALPTLEARKDANILAPTIVGLFLCTDIEWKGICVDLRNGPGLCINLNETFAGQVSAIGPDKEASGCSLWDEQNCKGKVFEGVVNPGYGDLTTVDAGWFNDKARSYICY